MIALVPEASLCLLVLLSSSDWAAVVEKVEVTGHSAVETKTLLEEFGITRGDSVGEEKIEAGTKRVLEVYRDIGYWRAAVDVEPHGLESGRVNLTLRVEEGEPALVQEIALEGNSLFRDDEILPQFDTGVGRPFRESFFRDDLRDLLERYADRGHPFCTIYPRDFSVDSSGVRFVLAVDEGPQVVIQGIEVEGNAVTKSRVIVREMRVKEGEIYSQSRVERGKKRVGRLAFLLGEPQVELRPTYSVERMGLVVKVVEGTMNSLSGALGWVPRAYGDGDGQLTGLVALSLGNLFGTGRRVEANWRRISSLSSLLGLEYYEPWLFERAVNLSLHFSHRIQDTSYAETDLGASVEFPFGEELFGECSVGWVRVIPGDLPVPKSTKYKGSLGAGLDTRDNRKNPSRGVLYRFSTEYGYKRNFPTELLPEPEPRARVVKGQFNFENFLPILSRQVLYLSLNGGEVRSNESPVPLSEHFKLGGAKTVRGYYEEEFSGERVAWANLEYRLLIGRLSRIAPFLDGGYFQYRRDTEGVVKGTRFGYGLGLRVGTGWGVFFIDYALGEGDGPLEGKVHFGAETEF